MTISKKLDNLVHQRNQLLAVSTDEKLKSINDEIASLELQAAADVHRQQRQSKIDSLIELAAQGAQALSDFETARGELAEAMRTHLATLAAAKQRLQQARTAFINSANELTGSALNRLLSFRVSPDETKKLETSMGNLLRELEQSGAQLDGVLIGDFFVARTAADRNYAFADMGAITPILDLVINQSSADFGVKVAVERGIGAGAASARTF
jgi:chromosome segregation ATPase